MQVTFTPGLTGADFAALLAGAAAEGGEHLARLLKFVVARAGEWLWVWEKGTGGNGGREDWRDLAEGRQRRQTFSSTQRSVRLGLVGPGACRP